MEDPRINIIRNSLELTLLIRLSSNRLYINEKYRKKAVKRKVGAVKEIYK